MILDPHQPYAWLIYTAVMAFYTMLEFRISLSYTKPLVFTSRNAIRPRKVIFTHVEFLAILLVFMWFVAYIYPSLPNWMTESMRGAPGKGLPSLVVILFFLAIFALLDIERRFIYVESDADETDSDNGPI
jgi:hypothetical protein